MNSLQSVVPDALAALLRRGPLSQGKVELAWRLSVGDAFSRVTTIRLAEDGVAIVTASDARWHRELSRSMGVIASKMNRALGPDTKLKLLLYK